MENKENKENKEQDYFTIDDMSKQTNGVSFHTNWNGFAKKTGCIKIIIDDKEVVIDKEHLWSIIFLLANESQKIEMVSPYMIKTRVTKYTKMIGVQTTRDVRKGELVQVLLEFTLNPETNEVRIGKGSAFGLITNRNSLGQTIDKKK